MPQKRGLPLPPDQQSSMADALAGADQEPQSVMGPNSTMNVWRQQPHKPADVATGYELERVVPLLRSKVDNFIEAIAGSRPPDEDAKYQAYKILENVFNVDFDQAAREYVKYKKANPVQRYITNLAVQHAVHSNADSYIDELLKSRLPLWERDFSNPSPDASPGITYQRDVLSGLRNTLQDKSIGGTVLKHLMDFRTLEQPIPFVQSKVNWLK